MQCNPTMAELLPIKQALLNIMRDGPCHGDFGICHNVDMQLTAYPTIDCYPILRELVQKWPDVVMAGDGDVAAYFIPTNGRALGARGWCWFDTQGDLRMQAMQFMVAEIDRRLAAMSALTA